MKIALIPAALLLATSALAAPSDGQLKSAVAAAKQGELALLQRMVDIDSGTGDVAGAGKVQDIVAGELRAIGGKVDLHPAEAKGLGDNLVARFEGTGKGRILIIAHVDTVFPAGTVAQRPFKIMGDRATGPGVGDEKGGVAEAITALKLLHAMGNRDYKSITFLVETSEERGSPGTRALIGELLKDADVELNMEPGDNPDAITVWRKGSTVLRVTVHGRAAHAGMAPQEGRNAALELIHQIATSEKFPHSGEGLTVNLTLIDAGERDNVIPAKAEAAFSVRNRKPEQLDEVIAAFKASAKTTVIPDTTVEVSTAPSFPPLLDNAATMKLADQARAIYAGLGRKLEFGGNGGASESAMASAVGVPALDGLGPVGGGFHGVTEHIDLTTVEPRLYLMTKLLIDLGHAGSMRCPAAPCR